MTCESGNTEGLEPVDFRPISRPWDWKLWTSGPFQDHGIGTLELLDLLGQEGLEPVDFRPISRPWDWNLWTSGPFQDDGIGTLGLLDLLGQDLFLANQAGWGVRGPIAPR